MNMDHYKEYISAETLMGPNSVRILAELFDKYPLRLATNDTILDLGCGTGLTSLIIAKETGARVFANDLWIKAEENEERFAKWGVLGQITPVCEDAYMFKSPKRWKELIGTEGTALVNTWEMECLGEVWNDWFATDHEFARGDRKYFETIIKPYTFFVGIYVRIENSARR